MRTISIADTEKKIIAKGQWTDYTKIKAPTTISGSKNRASINSWSTYIGGAHVALSTLAGRKTMLDIAGEGKLFNVVCPKLSGMSGAKELIVTVDGVEHIIDAGELSDTPIIGFNNAEGLTNYGEVVLSRLEKLIGSGGWTFNHSLKVEVNFDSTQPNTSNYDYMAFIQYYIKGAVDSNRSITNA